jgi:ketosteroid isomerase-like protein
LEVLVVVTVVIAAAMMAKSYFRTDTEQMDLWKKSAENQNELLNKALKDKDIGSYREMLDPDITRFYPKLPYRADGAKSVAELTKGQLESNEGAPEPMLSKKVQSYNNCIIFTYTFIMKGKQAEKPFDFTGKATRVWARGKGGRWFLAHEHISFNA